MGKVCIVIKITVILTVSTEASSIKIKGHVPSRLQFACQLQVVHTDEKQITKLQYF